MRSNPCREQVRWASGLWAMGSDTGSTKTQVRTLQSQSPCCVSDYKPSSKDGRKWLNLVSTYDQWRRSMMRREKTETIKTVHSSSHRHVANSPQSTTESKESLTKCFALFLCVSVFSPPHHRSLSLILGWNEVQPFSAVFRTRLVIWNTMTPQDSGTQYLEYLLWVKLRVIHSSMTLVGGSTWEEREVRQAQCWLLRGIKQDLSCTLFSTNDWTEYHLVPPLHHQNLCNGRCTTMFLSIQISSLLLLVAFWVISTTVARAVGENLELDQTNADLLRKPVSLGISKESTIRSSLNTDRNIYQSIPQFLATSSTPEGNGYKLTDHSLETPQQQPSNPLSISTANLDTTKIALSSPPSQQLGADKVPDADYHTQPITPLKGPVSEDVALFPSFLPSCPDGLNPVCAFGEPFYDFFGNLYLKDCYWCKHFISFRSCFFLSSFLENWLPPLWLTMGKTLIKRWNRDSHSRLSEARRERMVLLGYKRMCLSLYRYYGLPKCSPFAFIPDYVLFYRALFESHHQKGID